MNLDQVFKKVVFLLGAGASKDADCKLSSEMLISLKEAINNLTPSDKDFIDNKEDFNEIYSFILASLKYQSTLKDSSISSNAYVNIEDFVMVLRQLIDKEFVIPYPLIGMMELMGSQKGSGYMKQLGQQGLRPVDGYTHMTNLLAAGEFPLAIFTQVSKLEAMKKKLAQADRQ
jgi:hypothetical protein